MHFPALDIKVPQGDAAILMDFQSPSGRLDTSLVWMVVHLRHSVT